MSVTAPSLADIVVSKLFPHDHKYINDPVGWMRERLGEQCWSMQREVAESVVANRYTAVQSCHDVGKSFLGSRLVAWWLDVHELGSAFAVSTAPTGPQVGAILWREIRRAHKKGQLAGRITLDNQWYMTEGGKRNQSNAEDELIAYGRKPADYDQAAFQGIHAEFVLVIIDEACGVPKQLYDAVDSLATNENARVLAIGNPDDPGAHFADICKPGSGWNTIKIDAFGSPNFTREQRELDPRVCSMLVSRQWVREREKRWGVGSPLWQSKVRGEFPDVSDFALLPPKILRIATETNLPGLALGRYGGDIARMGDDKTELYRNRGGMIRHEDSWAKLNTMETANRFARVLRRHGANRVPMVVDSVGLGSGVYDRMRELNLNVLSFVGSERAFNFKRFKNRRAEIFWKFREACEDGEIDLDPADEDLLNQLGSIQWYTDNQDRITIESKEDMKKRGLPSPDKADAAVMSTVKTATASEILEAQDAMHAISHNLMAKVL
jgi:hypothetical protein